MKDVPEDPEKNKIMLKPSAEMDTAVIKGVEAKDGRFGLLSLSNQTPNS